MPDEWIIRVDGRDYGPADLDTLEEWKGEGRVLAQNPARRATDDLWTTASAIPGLFNNNTEFDAVAVDDQHSTVIDPVAAGVDRGSEGVVAAVPAAAPLSQASPQPRSTFGQVLANTFRIYRKGFLQFFYLTLLVTLPWLCGQLSAFAVDAKSQTPPDLQTAAAAAFTLCMFVIALVAWPVFVAGIQILTAELAAGRPARITALLPEVLKFWPRVAILCIFVYLIFFLLLMFAFGILAMSMVGGSSGSLMLVVLALGLLVLQVWMFGRFFINVLFWQQYAVLADSDPGTALRQSKELARSGSELPWHQRPMWRGVFISSLWVLFLMLLYIGPEWSLLKNYYHIVMTTTDPQAMLEAIRANQPSTQFNMTMFGLGLLERLVRPLLGIAFVLLYLDSESR